MGLLADKYRITLDSEEWEELETFYQNSWYDDVETETNILYADVNGRSCLEIFDDYKYNEIERLLNHREVELFTNENKDFHILVQSEY